MILDDVANTQVVNGQIPESTKRKGNNSIGIREERSQTRSLSCPHADLASLCCSSMPVPSAHPPLIRLAPAPPGCVKPAARLCCCSWVTIFYKPLQQKGSHPCHCYTSPRAAVCLCLASDLNRPHCMASPQWQAAAACLHCEPP